MTDSSGRSELNLPIPVPVKTGSKKSETILVVTKFLSWLTAVLLATAVIISLVSITSERNNLREQLSNQSAELACRFRATTGTAKATSEFQAALGRHNVILGDFVLQVIEGDRESPDYQIVLIEIAERLREVDIELDGSIGPLEQAIKDQQKALKDCSLSS